MRTERVQFKITRISVEFSSFINTVLINGSRFLGKPKAGECWKLEVSFPSTNRQEDLEYFCQPHTSHFLSITSRHISNSILNGLSELYTPYENRKFNP